MSPGSTGPTSSSGNNSSTSAGTPGWTGPIGTVATTPTPPKEATRSIVFPLGLAAILILSFFIVLTTGSFLAVGVLWILVAMTVLLLQTYGFINTAVLAPLLAVPVAQPVGSATSSLTNVTTLGNEVFHISDNKFTYDDAPAVCAAYGGQLATLEQIIHAYNHGAEWCGYGWSAGGMALYPTQKGTWDALQGLMIKMLIIGPV